MSLRTNLHVGVQAAALYLYLPLTPPQSSDASVKRADRIAYLIPVLDFFTAVLVWTC